MIGSNTTFETFQPSLLGVYIQQEPSVFNGMCRIRKYRITIEEIPEENEVLVQRLLNIWNRRKELGLTHSDDTWAMRREAEGLGVKLPQ